MIQPLWDALLNLLILYTSGPRVIMIQICISLAALALQLQSWNTAIPDVVNACTTPKEQIDALLQFLAVLPEEACDGSRMILMVPRFEINHHCYRKLNSMIALKCFWRIMQTKPWSCWSDIRRVIVLILGSLWLISQHFKTTPTSLLFSCLTSWLTEIPIARVTSMSLLHLAFESLYSEELFDAAVELIVAMLRETNDVKERLPSIQASSQELVPNRRVGDLIFY